jgi:hypothetical protein
MDTKKRRRRQWLEEAWHGIIGNTAYDLMKRILAVLWLIVGPWLISLGQRALGAAIPAVREALSTKVVLTVGTISAVVLWLLLGFIFAGLVGFVSSRILWYQGRVTAIRRPQTITLTTEKTLWRVLVDGCKSLLMRIILIVFFVTPWLVGTFLLVTTFVLGWEKVSAFVRSMAQP